MSVAVDEPRRRAGASLTIVLPEGDTGPIEIWSAADGAPKLVATIAPEGDRDARVLRAVEVARALGVAPALPKPAPPAPPPPPTDGVLAPPPPPPAREPASLPPAVFDLEVAPALGLQAQGPSMALDLALHLWPHARFGGGAFVEVPLAGALVTRSEGSATVRPSFVAAELVIAPIARTDRVSAVLAPGIGLAYVTVSGAAHAPFNGQDVSAFGAAIQGRAELRVRLAHAVDLAVGGLAGATLPPVAIRFAGHVVSSFAAHGSLSAGVVVER